ncbi:hypothetical protein ACUN0C_10520 [Faunimonas sp. B44]|uniref:hypothetical protein n=1 Tax=Faunimonas sp. B44 TaxID=3461493 RepID=UPI004044D223
MSDDPIQLDEHRGMAAQKATELRRLVSEVAAERAKLQQRQDELENALAAAPAETWAEAVEKARYLLALFGATSEGQDPRRQKLIQKLLEDFERLLAEPEGAPETAAPAASRRKPSRKNPAAPGLPAASRK